MMTPNSFDSSLSTLHHPSINTAVLALYDVLYHRRNLGGTRGTGSTTFWTEGYHTLTSQNKNVKNLLSPAVSRGDLRRSKLFWPLPWTPLGELMSLSQTPESGKEGIRPPHSSPLSPRGLRVPRSPSELVSPLLDQSYAPDILHIIHSIVP